MGEFSSIKKQIGCTCLFMLAFPVYSTPKPSFKKACQEQRCRPINLALGRLTGVCQIQARVAQLDLVLKQPRKDWQGALGIWSLRRISSALSTMPSVLDPHVHSFCYWSFRHLATLSTQVQSCTAQNREYISPLCFWLNAYDQWSLSSKISV